MLYSRATAIRKLGLPAKIFDWFCFLNGITAFCPRRRSKGNNSIYLSSQNIRKIGDDPLFLKIQQMISWKKFGRKMYKKLKTKLPVYNFYSIIRKRFPDFKTATQLFMKLLPFFILGKKFSGIFPLGLKNSNDLEFLSSKCLFLIKQIGSVTGVREERGNIRIQTFVFNQKKNFVIPLKEIGALRKIKTFELSLIRFYFRFMEFILSKFFFSQKNLFLNPDFYFFKEIQRISLQCPFRLYSKGKKKRIKKKQRFHPTQLGNVLFTKNSIYQTVFRKR